MKTGHKLTKGKPVAKGAAKQATKAASKKSFGKHGSTRDKRGSMS